MMICPPDIVQTHVEVIIGIHRTLHEQDPRQVIVGLHEMAALERLNGVRAGEQGMVIDNVPIVVGSLNDGVFSVP